MKCNIKKSLSLRLDLYIVHTKSAFVSLLALGSTFVSLILSCSNSLGTIPLIREGPAPQYTVKSWYFPASTPTLATLKAHPRPPQRPHNTPPQSPQQSNIQPHYILLQGVDNSNKPVTMDSVAEESNSRYITLW